MKRNIVQELPLLEQIAAPGSLMQLTHQCPAQISPKVAHQQRKWHSARIYCIHISKKSAV